MAARRAVVLSTFFSALNLGAGFAASLVLARLLTPHDIGVFSIGVVIIGVLGVFRDFGADVYSQQVKDLTPERIGSVLGLTLTAAGVLSFALVLVTPYVESYFAAEGLTSVMHVLLLSFLLIPVTSMMTSQMSRQLQVGIQAKVNLGGALAHATVGVLCASAGLGAAALAWANLANVVTGMCIAIACGVTLKVWPRLRGWHEPARFGFGAMLANLSKVVHQGIPDLLLGRMLGPHEVGLYSRGNGLVSLFQQIVMPVLQFTALPLLSRQHHASQALDSAVVRGSGYLTVLLWPTLAWTALFSAEIIEFLYGATWLPAAVVVGPLCVVVAVRMGLHLIQTALVAIGQPYVNAGLQVIALLLRVACIAVARPKDIESFAMALIVAELLVVPAVVFAGRRWLGLRVRDVAGYHMHSALVTLACLTMLAFVHRYGGTQSSFLMLLMSGGVLVLTWVLAVVAFKHPIREEWLRWRAQRTGSTHGDASQEPSSSVGVAGSLLPPVDFSVTLVIPTYNRAALIGETIQSALQQSRPFDEIIVIDDGSTDGTEAVVKAFGASVRYVCGKNAGVQAARNLGVSLAQSSFIVLCDSDDLLVPEYLSTMEAAFRARPDLRVIYSNFQNFSVSRTWSDKLSQAPIGWLDGAKLLGKVWSDIPDLYVRTLKFQPFFPSGMMLDRQLYEDLGGFNVAFKGVGAEDWEFALRVCETKRVGITEVPLVLIRRHDGNDSASSLHMNLGEAKILSFAADHHAAGRSFRRQLLMERRRRLLLAFDAAFAQGKLGLAESIRMMPGFRDRRLKGQVKRWILLLPVRAQDYAWSVLARKSTPASSADSHVVLIAPRHAEVTKNLSFLKSSLRARFSSDVRLNLWVLVHGDSPMLQHFDLLRATDNCSVNVKALRGLGATRNPAQANLVGVWHAWRDWRRLLPRDAARQVRAIILVGPSRNWLQLLCLLGLGARVVVLSQAAVDDRTRLRFEREGVTFTWNGLG